MDSNTFMGLLIASLAVLIGMAGGVTTLFIKPINRLSDSITKLATKMEYAEKEREKQEKRITKNEQKIGFLDKAVAVHEEVLDKLTGGKEDE